MSLLPRSLGPYWLVKEVAQGGFATLFLAVRDGKPFLLKCLKPERAGDKAAVEQFLQEVQIASHVSHRNVASFIDSGKVRTEYFGVMDFRVAQGLNILLAQMGEQFPVPPLAFTLFVMEEVIAALRYLHQTTVFEYSDSVLFHGDLSPDNILIGDDGMVQLTDFGSSGQVSFADIVPRHFGKLAYLPFETSRRAAPTPATDVYALGVIFFELLFGRRPFSGKTTEELLAAVRTEPVPRLPASYHVASSRDEAALRILLNQAMHKDPNLRFKTVDEFEAALRKIRFSVPRAENAEAVRSYFPPGFRKYLGGLRQTWEAAIEEGLLTVPKVFSVQVEDVRQIQNRRRSPRVRVDPASLKAMVSTQDRRWRSEFPVHEMSRGGLLMRWESLTASPGQIFPLQLPLDGARTPLRVDGEVCYELSRKSKLFLGLKFVGLDSQAQERIDQFIQQRLPATSKPEGSETIRVVFETESEWRHEVEENLQFGGLYVQSASPLTINDEVEVEIVPPKPMRSIRVRARVVFHQRVRTPSSSDKPHCIGLDLYLSNEQLEGLKTES